ncbi:MAG: DUF87 domain-containing protein [Flavobacteriales bacterium]|nr:DUF87 domain-containing protein [Flavobacteriales bacterium]
MNREIKLIFGKTGSGKSYFVKNKILPLFSRLVIIDPQLEYEGLIFTDYSDLANFHLENSPESFRYVCRFNSDLDIDFLFRWCYAVGNLCLVVEEAEQYISPYAKSSNFLYLVRYGRHKSISIIGIARRLSELSTDFKAQVNEIISFKQTLPLDLKLAEQLGLFGLDKLGKYETKIVQY